MTLFNQEVSTKIQGVLATIANTGAFALTFSEINIYLKTISLFLGLIIGVLTIRKFIKEWK